MAPMIFSRGTYRKLYGAPSQLAAAAAAAADASAAASAAAAAAAAGQYVVLGCISLPFLRTFLIPMRPSVGWIYRIYFVARILKIRRPFIHGRYLVNKVWRNDGHHYLVLGVILTFSALFLWVSVSDGEKAGFTRLSVHVSRWVRPFCPISWRMTSLADDQSGGTPVRIHVFPVSSVRWPMRSDQFKFQKL